MALDPSTPGRISGDGILRCLRFGYAHYIERLMVLGGVLFLSRIRPDAVYR